VDELSVIFPLVVWIPPPFVALVFPWTVEEFNTTSPLPNGLPGAPTVEIPPPGPLAIFPVTVDELRVIGPFVKIPPPTLLATMVLVIRAWYSTTSKTNGTIARDGGIFE
jgi:hypothetical protein